MSDSVRPPEMAAHQAPPSLGFSRQEHWSGLPFPSPMHESEKWKGSRSVVSDSSQPHGLQATRLLHPWDFPGKSTGVGCHCLLQSNKKVADKVRKIFRGKTCTALKTKVRTLDWILHEVGGLWKALSRRLTQSDLCLRRENPDYNVETKVWGMG